MPGIVFNDRGLAMLRNVHLGLSPETASIEAS
jgi:hypothetical protein